MTEFLPLIWFCIIGLELTLYVLLDGANLGIGILSLSPQKEKNRSLFLHTISPTWVANETWLLVTAGSLFGAFPIAFSIVLNALYIPGIIMLIGIILRSVSFEFYNYTSGEHKRIWSFSFGIGSLLMAVGQGCILGGILSGITISDGHFAGGMFDWATPFTLLFVIGICCGYAALGSAYIIRKTGREFSREPFRRVLFLIFISFFTFVSAAIFPPQHTRELFINRWFNYPSNIILHLITITAVSLMLVLLFQTYYNINVRRLYPFMIIISLCGLIGVFSGIFPYMIPPDIPYWAVSSPTQTLVFMLWGIGPILPIILVYSWYLNFVFRHKPETPKRTQMYNKTDDRLVS